MSKLPPLDAWKENIKLFGEGIQVLLEKRKVTRDGGGLSRRGDQSRGEKGRWRIVPQPQAALKEPEDTKKDQAPDGDGTLGKSFFYSPHTFFRSSSTIGLTLNNNAMIFKKKIPPSTHLIDLFHYA